MQSRETEFLCLYWAAFMKLIVEKSVELNIKVQDIQFRSEY